ncbi:glycosyltransferase [Naasia aerilata]|uniref:Glycosyl transferase n=1 Tax=Naasia aerilata TaxID=1162966 RepID=A0ABM8GCX3_9MICO|nr:nucleotide disphospho-sugar-binding domain-containing protein [Naasia aerilata]BDZ46116.1 glycosyl transferase [Naasia aerilata]
MSDYLICSSPIYGHLAPMVTIGRALVSQGHRVTVLTGRKYGDLVERSGMTFRPLPSTADYDDANLDAWLPGRDKYKGLAAVRYDIIGMFVKPIPDQYRAVQEALSEQSYDAILGEVAFLGLMPMLLKEPAGTRVPVVGVSALPLTLTSVDCAPYGSALQPGSSAISRLRNRVLNAVLLNGPLRPIRVAANEALAEVGAPAIEGSIFNQIGLFDRVFQLSAPGIEYPRRELPATVSFVGPLRPEAARGAALPSWWGDLDGDRPVVHVTQGTLDNFDLSRVLAPAIRGLAGEDVLVVAATGGRPVEELTALFGGELPANARVAEFLPYDQLLPKTSVVVTNGGFGGVQQALAHGVPLIVAGATEDKPEVAARVAWAGVGVDLHTGTPKPEAVAAAVRTVLAEPRFRTSAARLQAQLADLGDPLVPISATLEQLVGQTASA